MNTLVLPSTQGVAQLEWPQKVVGSFEVRTARVNFMDQILNANNSLLAETVSNDFVVGQRYTLLVHLGIPTLVNELADCLQRRFAIRDVRFDVGEHRHRGKVHFDECCTVELKQAKELQNLLSFGRYAHDPPNAHEQKNLGHILNEVVSIIFSLAFRSNKRSLGISVLFHILLCPLENVLSCCALFSSHKQTWLRLSLP